MSMDPAVSLEDLERRRRRASATRKASMTLQAQSTLPESEAMAVINEIFNPKLKLPESTGHYTLPEELSAHDLVSPQDLDIAKLAELKEVFLLFDTDCDGLISKDDLRFTYTALGNEPNEQLLEQMMQEAHEPLDYEAFVQLMCRRTQELDPEDVLLEAWSKWDDYGTGKIDERKIYEELTNYGDKMSVKEAKEALSHAPMAKPKTLEEPPMIDYPAFCRMLSGMRKPKKH
ncbi:myosin regulatory light chain, striated adductor muscle [Drosophila busckii]|uniref:myosin regulatory light chain, striated adductor muscle n=1 Tax=Drosophila busckii TaxID=30019 RepID=UPI00083F1E57|nr:myosin regulatory light chain, striated adductor muscle [Drosophila busckii]